MGFGSSLSKEYFADNFKCILGNGKEIVFWSNKWMGSRSLNEAFPVLLDINSLLKGNVAELRDWVEGI